MPGSAIAAAKWHTRRVPLGLFALLADGALRGRARAPPTPSAGLPRARPAGTPTCSRSRRRTRARPRSARSRRISRRSVCSRPGGSRCSRAGASATTRRTPSRPALTARGARLVPVLADPEHLAGDLLTNGPLRRRLAVRLSVALRALGARGVVLDWRDLPPAARAQYPMFVHELRVELGQAAADRGHGAARAHAAARSGTGPTTCARSRDRPGCSCWRGTSTGRAASPGPVASLAFWKQHAAHGAACRAALARADGRADLGLALERHRRRGRAGDAGRALPARPRERRSRAPTARASASARGSSPIAPCSSSCSPRARRASPVSRSGCAVASPRRPGVSRSWCRRTAERPRGSTARSVNGARGSLPRGGSGSRRRRRRSSTTTAPPTRPPTTTRRARRSRERPPVTGPGGRRRRRRRRRTRAAA